MTAQNPRLEHLHPGDKVLLVFDREQAEADAQQTMNDLRHDFPDVRFTGIVGASYVFVQPAPVVVNLPGPEPKLPEIDPDELRIHVQSKQPSQVKCQHIWPDTLMPDDPCGVCGLPYGEWST